MQTEDETEGVLTTRRLLLLVTVLPILPKLPTLPLLPLLVLLKLGLRTREPLPESPTPPAPLEKSPLLLLSEEAGVAPFVVIGGMKSWT